MSTTHPSTTEDIEAVSFSYAEWRQEFLNIILRGASIVGLFVAIAASIDTPLFLVVVYVLSYLVILVVTFAPLPYHVRSIGFLATVMAIAISALLQTGIRADARLFLLAFVVMTAMLFGRRAGVMAVGASLIPVVIIGYLIVTGHYRTISTTIGGNTEILTWIVAVLVLLLVETLILTGLNSLQRGFDTALRQSQRMFEIVLTERASLEQRVDARTAELKASADVGRVVTSISEPEQLLKQVVSLIAERFGFYYTAAFIVDEVSQMAVLRAATGEAGRTLLERGHHLAVNSESMVGAAIRTRRARIALDVENEAMRFANPLLPATRSEIALPLIVGERVFGALDVQSTQVGAFDEASATVLQSMADQIAIALYNATSYAESQAIARRSRALYAASSEVGRLQPDLANTIGAMMRGAAGNLLYDHWCVMAFDETRNSLVPIATQDWPDLEQPLSVITHSVHPLVRSALRNEALLIQEPDTDSRLQGLPSEQRANLFRLISVPVDIRGTLVGAMALGRTAGAPLTTEDLEIGRSLASLAAVAIENHRLLETTQRTFSELDAVNRRLTGESWEAYTRRRTKDGILWVSRTDKAQPQLLPEIGEALSSGRVVTRVLDDPTMLGVAVPIQLRGVPVGALRLTMPHRAWNNETEAALQSIAGHVAQASENARLLNETEQRFARERALSEAADKVRRNTDVERVLETAAAELARYLNASRVAVRLTAERSEFDGNGQ